MRLRLASDLNVVRGYEPVSTGDGAVRNEACARPILAESALRTVKNQNGVCQYLDAPRYLDPLTWGVRPLYEKAMLVAYLGFTDGRLWSGSWGSPQAPQNTLLACIHLKTNKSIPVIQRVHWQHMKEGWNLNAEHLLYAFWQSDVWFKPVPHWLVPACPDEERVRL